MLIRVYGFVIVFEQWKSGQVDELGTHPSDYAIFVRGLPPTATDEGKIMEFFEAHAVPGQSCAGKVLKVVVGYDVRGVFSRDAAESSWISPHARSPAARHEGFDQL